MLAQKITFDLMQSKLDDIRVVQGDSCREIQFEGSDLEGVLSYDDYTYEFDLMKSDGTFFIQTLSAGILIPSEQMEVITGTHYYNVKIKDADNELVYSGQGAFIVDDNVITEEAIESIAEVNGLVFPDDFLTVNDHVAFIDDTTTSEDSTWSSQKIQNEIDMHSHVISKTVTGNPITFDDGADAPLVKCVTQITGSQDLHGYDKPWVGGAGKNKLPMTVDSIKSFNTSAMGYTWVGNSCSIFGVTYTLLTDDGDNVIGIKATSNVAASGMATLYVYGSNTSTSSNISINNDMLCTIGLSGSESTFRGIVWKESGGQFIDGGTVAINANDTLYGFGIRVVSGYTVPSGGIIFLPMIRADETPPAYEPYSNICPITAYTEGEIEVSDGDGNTTTHTTTYPSAIYRGSENCVNGTVECEVKYFTPTTWSRNADHSYYTRDFMTELSSTGNVPCICDKLREWDGEEPTTNYGICFVNSAGAIRINTVNAYASVEDMVADIGEMHFACTLPTPTTSPVAPTNLPIKSLSGYTHIESSTGDMEVEYITAPYQPLIDSISQLI